VTTSAALPKPTNQSRNHNTVRERTGPADTHYLDFEVSCVPVIKRDTVIVQSNDTNLQIDRGNQLEVNKLSIHHF